MVAVVFGAMFPKEQRTFGDWAGVVQVPDWLPLVKVAETNSTLFGKLSSRVTLGACWVVEVFWTVMV